LRNEDVQHPGAINTIKNLRGRTRLPMLDRSTTNHRLQGTTGSIQYENSPPGDRVPVSA